MLTLVGSTGKASLLFLSGWVARFDSFASIVSTDQTIKQFLFEHPFSTPSSFVNQLRKGSMPNVSLESIIWISCF